VEERASGPAQVHEDDAAGADDPGELRYALAPRRDQVEDVGGDGGFV